VARHKERSLSRCAEAMLMLLNIVSDPKACVLKRHSSSRGARK
jgi:hypothetical protein